MFWKLIEVIVRIVYFPRFRKAKKIGQAGELLAAGKPKEALDHLERHGASVHHSLLSLYAFTRGAILTALERFDEAEAAYHSVLLADPGNPRAPLELGVFYGRLERYPECRQWLGKAAQGDDEEIRARATRLLTLMAAIEAGDEQTIALFEQEIT